MDFSFYLQKSREIIADPSPPANATLTFSEAAPTATVTFDDLGNPVVSDAVPVELTCWLRQAKVPENQIQSGRNLSGIYVEGELVDPKVFPLPLKPNGAIQIVFNDRPGTFTPVDFPDSPGGYGWQINRYHGQRIAGWIQFDEGN